VNISGVLDALTSHALASGLYEAVNNHEPKSKNPTLGTSLTAALWVQQIAPIRASGLAVTSGRVEFTLRNYTSMLSEPQDAIDPAVMNAVDVMMAAYSGDFTLGGLIRQVDLLGAYGNPLSAVAGYLNQSGRLFRVMDMCVPLVIDDLWGQEATGG
jgi:hypothetical protein